MIYAIGLGTDRTMTHFLVEAARHNVAVRPIDLRAVVEASWRFDLPADRRSWVVAGGARIELDPDAAYYCRLIDLSSTTDDKSLSIRWRALLVGLSAWLETIPGLVINRPGHHGDNSSKPLHEATLTARSFRVPPSLTSSDGDRLRAFAAAGPTVVKAISGVRTDCRRVTPEEFVDFESRRGPVHLQRMVHGSDVRAHVIGSVVHAEVIVSDAVDYRTAERDCTFREIELAAPLRERIVRSTGEMGLVFAGWDFKVTPEGEFWCLEANPMPGYNGYDVRAGGRITESLLRHLAAGVPRD